MSHMFSTVDPIFLILFPVSGISSCSNKIVGCVFLNFSSSQGFKYRRLIIYLEKPKTDWEKTGSDNFVDVVFLHSLI